MQKIHLEIEGMSCDHCVHTVRKALEAIPGLQVDQVSVGNAVVRIQVPAQLERTRAAIEEEGYQVTRETELS